MGGVVRNESGEPLEAAIVRGSNKLGLSDENGVYILKGLFAGTHDIRVGLRGYFVIVDTFTIGSGVEMVKDFVMIRDPSEEPRPPKTGDIQGTVRDTNNNRVQGATVKSSGQTATTSNIGVFFMDGLPSGQTPFTLSKEGYLTTTQTSLVETGVSVTGHFVMEKVVSPPPPVPTVGTIQGTIKDEQGNNIVSATVRINGLMVLTTNAGFYRHDNVEAGTVNITVTKEGFEPRSDTLPLKAGATVTRNFTMTKIVVEPPPEPEPEKTILEIITELLTLAIGTGISFFTTLTTIRADINDKAIQAIADDTGKNFAETKAMVQQAEGTSSTLALGLIGSGPLVKAGLTATAAKSLSKTAVDRSATEIIRLGSETPKALAKLYNSFPEVGRKLIFANLRSTATGRIALVSLQKALGKNPTLAGRIANIDLAKGAIKTLLGGAGLLLFVGFIKEEAIQQFNMAMFNLTRSGDWEAADKEFPIFKAGIEAINSSYDAMFAIPFFGPVLETIYKPIADSAELQVRAIRTQIDAGLEAGETPTTITVTTNVDPAQAEIIGIEAEFETPFTESIAPGSYSVQVSKEGFNPVAKTAIVKSGQDNPLSFTLTEITPAPEPKVGRLQLGVFAFKTGASIKGTLFIDDVAEKFHLHSYTIDLDPGLYQLRVEEPLYEDFEDTISITKGEITDIRAELKKIVEPPPIEPPTEPPPGEEPPLTNTKGRLELSSDPEAKVFIAGKEVVSKTPATIELAQGFYDLVFKAAGHKDLRRSAVIKTGELTRLAVSLASEEIPTPGVLLPKVIVNSNPTGAKILINGEWTKEFTPSSVLLLPGEYELSLTKSGFEQWFFPLKLVRD